LQQLFSWQHTSKQQVATSFQTNHGDKIHDVQMDYYGKRVVTTSSDATMKIFDVVGANHVLVAQLAGHSGPVWKAAWAHPTFGTLLASCSYDRRVIMWREDSPNVWSKIFEDASAGESVTSVAWAPHQHGLVLAAASADGHVSVFTYTEQKAWDHKRFVAHLGGVTGLSWAQPDAANAQRRRFCTVGFDNQVKVWTFGEAEGIWQEQKAFVNGRNTHGAWVRDCAWAPTTPPQAQTIATASDDMTVGVWREDARTGQWQQVAALPFAAKPWRVSWSVMGDILAVATEGGGAATTWKESASGQWVPVEETVGSGGGGGVEGVADAAAPVQQPVAAVAAAAVPAQPVADSI
jgi:protein transport protein SEC13